MPIKKANISLYFTLLLLGIFTSTASAQTASTKEISQVNQTVGKSGKLLAQTEENATSDTQTIIFSPRVGAGYTTEGSGFNSYGSFEGFFPLMQTPR